VSDAAPANGRPLPVLGAPEPGQHTPAEVAAADARYDALVARIRGQLSACRDLPGLEDFQTTGQLPRAFIDHYGAAMQAYDELIDFALEFTDESSRIQCKKGCSNCCVDLVRGITVSELIYLYNTVRWWDDCKQLFEYHSESAKQFSLLLMSKVAVGEEPPHGGDPRVAEAHVEYNQLLRPCGFLDQKEGLCRIHAVRPIICRAFFSFDPAETCSPRSDRYLTRSTRTVHLPEEIHLILRAIDRRFGFRPLNYLSGGFCQFTANIMKLKPIQLT
jgi:Fe-S-cluster containining protein